MDLIIDEVRQTKGLIDIDFILYMQLEHDIQIVRGSDWQYECWIDKKCYATSLTPMFALFYGVKTFRELSLEN